MIWRRSFGEFNYLWSNYSECGRTILTRETVEKHTQRTIRAEIAERLNVPSDSLLARKDEIKTIVETVLRDLSKF